MTDSSTLVKRSSLTRGDSEAIRGGCRCVVDAGLDVDVIGTPIVHHDVAGHGKAVRSADLGRSRSSRGGKRGTVQR